MCIYIIYIYTYIHAGSWVVRANVPRAFRAHPLVAANTLLVLHSVWPQADIIFFFFVIFPYKNTVQKNKSYSEEKTPESCNFLDNNSFF